MNLLYVSSPGGGLDTNVRVLGPELVKAGHRVSILYIHLSGQKANDVPPCIDGCAIYHADIGSAHYYLHRATMGLTSLPLLVRSLEYARALSQATRLIRGRTPIDLIEIPEVFVSQHQLHGIPYIVRLHSSAWMWRRMFCESSPVTDRLEVRLEGYTLKHASALSSPSRAVGDYIRAACHVDGKTIETIPYPVDTQRFTPAGARSQQPLVLFVGRVERRKGAGTLMRAIPLIWAQHPDCEFVFVGRVCDDVEEQVAAMPARVQFLGVRPHEELVAWYQRAAIFVAPSLWDNSPNTIYEAMACGTPVVASRVGGIPELVDDGETGLLVPPADERALADALSALLDEPARRERIGQRGREKVVADYSVNKILTKTLKFYEHALSGR
jgi:glycosyltransferase involved in cell wall biosynthesis